MSERRQYQRAKTPKQRDPITGAAIHPLIRFIWARMNADEWSQEDIAKRAGVSSSAMRKWRNGSRSPKLADVEAVINALGYRLRTEEME